VELRLLGPVEVVDDNGAVLDIRGEKQRALVALLGLRVGDVVTTSQIAASLWGEQDLRDPGNAVQVLVSKLRRSLRPGSSADGRQPITTTQAGYQLDIDPTSVDATRFEQLTGEGSRLLTDGDAVGASEILNDALALWRGPPLADLGDDFCRGERTRLEALHTNTLEARIDADLELGRHDQLLPELEVLIAAHPLRERLRGQQMLALYRAGRQVDALRAYQAARQLLAEEVGVDPGPELQRLEAEILAQSPDLQPREAPTPRLTRHGNLPAPISPFVGRGAELQELDELIDGERLVTILGPGGAGKTRVALEAAARALPRHPDGCWLVELASVTDEALVEATVLDALALESGAQLDDYGMTRQALVVVDNCEHVVEAAATLVTRLLRSGPGVVVVATSREGLGVTGEHRWLVPPLAPDDAQQLFVDRTRRAGSGPQDEQLDLVGEICAQLDGLPLAVELAAARTRTLSLEDIAARINDRFGLLTTGERLAQPRQQTLRGVVDWSYDLLFADEKRVFRRLSAFAGGFDLYAAERVVADEALPITDVVDILARLVEKSLVGMTNRQGAGRYQLLQTLVDYGRERLVEADEEMATRDRHLTWMADLAAQARSGLETAEQGRWVEKALAERHNLQAAAAWAMSSGRAGEATAMAADVGYAWLVTGTVTEGRVLFETVLETDEEVSNEDRGRACAWAAYLTQFLTGSTDAVVDLSEQGIALTRVGDARWFGQAVVMGAVVLDHRGRTAEALLLVEEAEARLEAEPDAWTQAYLDWAHSGLLLKLGRRKEATASLRRSAEGFAALGEPTGGAMANLRLSELADARGDAEEAFASALASYEAAVASGGRRSSTSFSATRLGNLATLRGAFGEADEWYATALARAREGGFAEAEAQALSGIGAAAERLGRPEDAETAHRQALAIYERSGSTEGIAAELVSLGYLATDRGDHDDAAALHGRSLREAVRASDRRTVAQALEGLATTRLQVEDGEGAALLLGAAAAIREELGVALPTARAETIETTEQAVRSLLGADAAEAAYARGGAQPEEVVAEHGAPPP